MLFQVKRSTTSKKISTWEDIKTSLSVGSRLSGMVKKHAPFGVFVTLPEIDAEGLIQITDFKDIGVVTPDEYPELVLRQVRIEG
ncbi:MAG: hypothetical protein J7642_02220 [Cyanobacteria bacterium SBC]|nr:hypothetical protein [Cyanobacteria bacterium SBC]